MADNFDQILKRIDQAISKFNKGIPGIQKGMLSVIQEQIKRLDLGANGVIKSSVANIKVFASIKAKMNRIILTDKYIGEVKDFANTFNDITKLQNDYWRTTEKTFTPKTLLKEIRQQSIQETVNKLTEAGIGANVGDKIVDILKTNVTSGGEYSALHDQLKESLTDTEKSPGILSKYAKQITVDSVNTYNAQYTNIVASDLGFEWYAWQGSEIMTSRPFCQSMVEERRYFHISEVPAMLQAKDMYYTDNFTEQRKKVPIYAKTNLPHGLIEGTNVENFFIRRGGYQCGHQARPVSDSIVPIDVKTRVYATDSYKAWNKDQQDINNQSGSVGAIRRLLQEGKTRDEIEAMGFNRGTINVQANNLKKELGLTEAIGLKKATGETQPKPIAEPKPIKEPEPFHEPTPPKTNEVKFIPAKTPKEAEEFAGENLASRGNVRYENVPLDTINKINETLVNLKNKYGKTFEVITSYNNTKVNSNGVVSRPLASTIGTKDLHINTDIFTHYGGKDRVDFELAKMKKTGWANIGNWEEVIVHEYGHLLTMSKLTDKNYGFKEVVPVSFNTSKYSKTSDAERLAEMFVMMHRGEAPDEFYDEFNKYSSVKIEKPVKAEAPKPAAQPKIDDDIAEELYQKSLYEMQKNQKKWLDKLTIEQKKPLLEYIDGKTNGEPFYLVANGYLRNPTQEGRNYLGEQGIKSIESLKALLAAAPKYQGKVYRGVTFDTKSSYESFKKQVESSSIYIKKDFTSSTWSRDTSILKFFQKEKYNIKFEIDSKNGVPVDLVKRSLEKEVLFNVNTKFKIKSVNETINSDGSVLATVHMEEID